MTKDERYEVTADVECEDLRLQAEIAIERAMHAQGIGSYAARFGLGEQVLLPIHRAVKKAHDEAERSVRAYAAKLFELERAEAGGEVKG
jgi:hypothetical protein